jgi:hypothetical protein
VVPKGADFSGGGGPVGRGGVGATRVVQHLTASGPAATGMPGTAAERPGTLNAESVYQAVEPASWT